MKRAQNVGAALRGLGAGGLARIPLSGAVRLSVIGEPAGMGLVDVYATVIPSLDFKPGVHVHYQETRLRIADGLPKMKDMPKEMGGSGLALAE